MLLYISRHPESKPEDDTVDDPQRQVTRKGAAKFQAVLELFEDAGEMSPDVIFCGPETRNMQAGEILRAFFDLKTTDVVQDENLAVDGDPAKLLADIKEWVAASGDPDKSEVCVVGSNPTLEDFFCLVHGLGTKAGQGGGVKLKKGSVVKLKVYGIDTDTPTSELRSAVPPGLAEAA